MRKIVALILAALIALSVATCGAEYDANQDLMIYNRNRAVVARVQEALNALGYECGKADGIAGNKTLNAIKAWEADNGIPEIGVIDDSMLESLGLSELIVSAAPEEEPAPEATEAPEEEPAPEATEAPEEEPAPEAPNQPAVGGMFAIDYTYIDQNPDMFAVTRSEEAGAVFIEAKLSAQERAFVHKYESSTRYSSTKFDTVVLNCDTPNACPLFRLWIIYCADDDYLDFDSATFKIAGKSYTFTNLTPSLSQDDQGYVEQRMILFGSDNLQFLTDLEDLFADADDAGSAALAMSGQLVLHGKEDLTVDLGGGFFLDFVVMKTGFVEMNGTDFLQFVDETPMTIE